MVLVESLTRQSTNQDFEDTRGAEFGNGFVGNHLYGIKPDAARTIAYRYPVTKKWTGPIKISYKPNDTIESSGQELVIFRDNDMMNDSCVILDPWRISELNTKKEEVKDGEMALAIIVLKEEPYSNSRIPHDRREELQQRYGVVPLVPEDILFQGVIRDTRPEDPSYQKDPDSLVFDYIPMDLITGGEIEKLQQERQKDFAQRYLKNNHPTKAPQTPLEVLVSQG